MSQANYRWIARYIIPYPEGWLVITSYFKSKAAISKYLGVSVSSITNWANGTYEPPLNGLINVEATDTPINDVPSGFIFAQTDEPPPKKNKVPDWIYMTPNEYAVDKLVNPEKYMSNEKCDISHLFNMPEGWAVAEGHSVLLRS